MTTAAAESTDSSAALDSKSDKDQKSRSAKGQSSSSKAKDTSHVPCKFFRVGSCAAGASCTFSHQILEPGQQKELCAWYLKGNCKFGHKCALAHGQTVSEDRRNKKQAQLSAGGGGAAGSASSGVVSKERGRESRERDKDGRGGRKSLPSSASQSASRSGPLGRNGLLSGSTAPTRVLPGSRPPLPISKSQLAPAEPAPVLQDADFTHPDEQKDSTLEEQEATSTTRDTGDSSVSAHNSANTPSVPAAALPTSPPPRTDMNPFPASPGAQQLRYTTRVGSGASQSVDYGPVGSPPQISPINPIRINGFSPGASPRDSALHTQPLTPGMAYNGTAPGAIPPQAILGEGEFRNRSGIAATMGTIQSTQAPFGVGSLPILSRGVGYLNEFSEAIDDEDMEEFVPSSLKDLLTPEEQSRRMSRTSTVVPGQNTLSPLPGVNRAGLTQDNRHRYSRSVPAPSLLSDIRSIWANSDGELTNGANKDMPTSITSNPLVGGLSTSYKSNFTDGPSPSMLHPANASAAFLSGLHSHHGRPGGGVRSVSHSNANLLQSSLGQGAYAGGNAINGAHTHLPSQLSMSMSIANAFPSSPSQHPNIGAGGRPIPLGANTHASASTAHMSPGARALQSHAPGQSLPQGLAAGYSRIHLQPATGSPSSSMALSPSAMQQQHQQGLGSYDQSGLSTEIGFGSPPGLTPGEHGLPPQAMHANGIGTPGQAPTQVQAATPTQAQNQTQGQGQGDAGVSGLTTMFSHLSYSSVARGAVSGHGHSVVSGSVGPGAAGPTGASAGSAVPHSMSRRTSARQWVSPAHALSSPLSGPVITNDDELFSMDEDVDK